MDAATPEGCPAWWISYIDPEEDNYEPCDARVLLSHKIMSHAPSWIASVGSFAFWGSDHAFVPVDMAALMAAVPHEDELHELLQETPEQFLLCLSACVHQLREDALQGRKVVLRPFNVPGALSLSSAAEPAQLDELVTLRGRVCGLTRTIPAAESIDYDCVKCKIRQRVTKLDSGGLQKPSTCKSRACRHRSVVPVPGTAEPVLWRCAWIMMEKDRKHFSHDLPAIVPVYATLEMTEGLAVGQVAEIYGIVKIAEMQSAEGEPESERVKLDTYVYAVSISKMSELKAAAIATMPNIHINDGDQGISMLAKHICVESKDHGVLASTIAAFLVFPQPRPTVSCGAGRVPARSLLIVGDHGMGSWELLENAAAKLHASAVMASCGPRVVLEPHPWCRNNSRSQELDAYRAGLLALHPDTTMCLEGLELLPASQHQALLEYLSIGMVSNRYEVSGSGMTGLLPGPGCIVATTTPVSGRYDANKSLCQNVSLPVALVERFDLVVLLQDRPEDPATRAMRACIRQRDGEGPTGRSSTQRYPLASAVGSTQTCTFGSGSSFYSPKTQATAPTPGQAVTQWHLGTLKAVQTDSQVSVVAPTPGVSGDRLSDSELGRFCDWLRSGHPPQPIWTADESVNAMAETFGQIRAEVAKSEDLAPVTSRHLEILHWLTLTVCRAGLCQTVQQSHIETAADMLFSSLCAHTIRGAAGAFDAPGSNIAVTGRAGRRVGFQARRQRFMAALHHQCLVEGSLTQTVDGMKDLARKSHTFNPDFDSFLERLNEHGRWVSC